jgi:hypothetical protein
MAIAALFLGGTVKLGFGAGLLVWRLDGGCPEAETNDGVCGWPRLELGRSVTDI